MTLPRVRFTVRRMMVAVVVVATAMATYMWAILIPARAAKYRRLADGYEFSESYYNDPSRGPPDSAERALVVNYLAMLKRKYDIAARHPWWPIDQDPPEPPEASKWGLTIWIDPDALHLSHRLSLGFLATRPDIDAYPISTRPILGWWGGRWRRSDKVDDHVSGPYLLRTARVKRLPSIPHTFRLRFPATAVCPPPAVIKLRPSGLNLSPMTHSGPSISRRIDRSAGFHRVIFPSTPPRRGSSVRRPFDSVKLLGRGLLLPKQLSCARVPQADRRVAIGYRQDLAVGGELEALG